MSRQSLASRLLASALATGVACALPATAAFAQPAANVQADAAFARFAPQEATLGAQIDYAIWDEAMNNLVFRMGRSLRETPGRAEASLGTKLIRGHDSRYRLEGNRIMFSFLTPEVTATFTEYRDDLERTAELVDIQQLSRNEQLAYWLNLHNVAVVEQVALAWPVRQPRQIKIDGVPLDEAKFITVKGVAMSPKDIRTQIVYPNWRDPRVIYGFWRGDIGGPSIQTEAFNGNNLKRLLARSASDFVNSLRGTQKQGDTLQVSNIYAEASSFYFPDWEADLRVHIRELAEADVKVILDQTTEVDASIYEYDIADLAGGVREVSYVQVTSNGAPNSFRVPPGMARLLGERNEKIRRAIKRGERTGTVTLVDFVAPGEEPPSNEVE